MPRQILVTSALPYANGSIHIGHLVEYIQTDIWVRYQRLRGNDVMYVCGDDAHGTAIMVNARKRGITPEALIADMKEQHKADFAKFSVVFDNFDTTNSDLNRALANTIYDRVKAAGFTTRREIEQFYDPVEKTFLADRFLRGTCPFCKTPDQYGGECENCLRSYAATELIEPRSDFSGATPVLKRTEHIYLRLEPSRDFLLKLYDSNFADPPVANKLREWFEKEEEQDGKKVKVQAPLKDWDISRDAHFFGFEIPGETQKYFYNWFDAPIGYIGSLGNKLGFDVKGVQEYWNNPNLEIYHFIGKDIQYFHCLFWPTMLNAAGFKIPTKVAVHGHLKVNGEKMSKSRGTFILASTFAKHLDPQYLRYYYATKLGPAPEDLDLSFEDFKARVDGELVNKLANLFSRGKLIANAPLNNELGVSAMDAVPLLRDVRAAEGAIAEAYETRNFAAAVRMICALADQANKYVEDQAPWKLAKTDPEAARGVLTAALEAGRILAIYLKPVLPEFSARVEKFLGLDAQMWRNVQDSMASHKINAFEHLVQRLDSKAVEAMVEESKDGAVKPAVGAPAAGNKPGAAAGGHPAVEPLQSTITIDQFLAVDLRVARVLTAQAVEKSDKLMKLSLDVGYLGQRTVLAGIKKAYTPEQLVGRLVVLAANLAPRTMGKFGTSEGMICASGPGGSEIFVLAPDAGATPGQRVH